MQYRKYHLPTLIAIFTIFAASTWLSHPVYSAESTGQGVSIQEVSPATPAVPVDVVGHEYAPEIMYAVRMGYMNLVDKTHFNPDSGIRAVDFLVCLKKVLEKRGSSSYWESKLDTPKLPITKQQAAKLIVANALSAQDRDELQKQYRVPAEYLSDYVDVGKISPWALSYMADAVFRGWISGDRSQLDADKPATRGFIAQMLSRAFPDKDDNTGLIVRVSRKLLKSAEKTVQIVYSPYEGPVATTIIYPDPKHLPPYSFLEMPGMISYGQSMQSPGVTRAGVNPLVVNAIEIRTNPQGEGSINGVPQIVISPEDGAKVQAADTEGLFLRRWSVVIVIEDEVPPAATTKS